MGFDGYYFRIHFSGEPHAIAEAAKIAEDSNTGWSKKYFDKGKLKTSSTRLEKPGDPDHDMDYLMKVYLSVR